MNAKNTLKATVKAVSVSRRCRAGLCFDQNPVTVEVTDEQLNALQADGYLQVEVVSDDAKTKQKGEETPPSAPNVAQSGGNGGLETNPEDEQNDDPVQTLVEVLRANGFDGKAEKPPTVDEVKKLTELKVNAELRDAAWQVLVQEADA